MFWKRKGKKKDGDEAGGSSVASSTVTTEDSTEDAEEPEAGAAAEDADGTAAGDAQAETTAAKDRTASSGEKEADDAEAEETSAAVEGDASADGNGGEETGAAEAAAAVDADAADAADDTEDSAGVHDGAEDADAEEAEDTKTGNAADADALSDEAEPEVPGVTEPDEDGVQRVRTAGALQFDGEEFDVVSNTWIVDADDEGVIVIDPAHDSEAILEAVGDREIYLVACTNGYNTHISAAVEVAERDEASIALHRRELRAWRKVHGAEHRPDLEIEGGGTLKVGDLEIDILPIPGTATGSVAYYIAERGVVFSGDSLRAGELGTVGGIYLDYTRQVHSIGEVVLSLPPDTRILPDSGPETTVEEESQNFDSWVSTN
ncbi:MAG: MBL fold metallo-hydrolase [Nocardiopsaceae bacterium]|nr:MBL fold metallo-hydrolase [Nocardiopsaceae bacterium]